MPDLTLAELGAALDRLGTEIIPNLMGDIRERVSLAVWHELPSRSPVGSASEGDPHPGKYRASHGFSADPDYFKDLPDLPSYGIPGDDEVLAVLAQTPIEDPVYAGNAVRGSEKREGTYSPALEAGRSPQAEEGIYGPTVADVGGQLEEIGATAVAKAEAAIG